LSRLEVPRCRVPSAADWHRPLRQAQDRLDQAGVDCEALAADQALGHAALDARLEQQAEKIAVAEAAVPVLGKGRVIRHRAVEAEAAEPAIGEIEVYLLAEPALRSDAQAIADEQHPDHQLGIDRGAAGLAVIGPQVLAQARQIHEPVDPPQQVIVRDVALQAEAVKQRLLHHRPLAHHRPASRPAEEE